MKTDRSTEMTAMDVALGGFRYREWCDATNRQDETDLLAYKLWRKDNRKHDAGLYRFTEDTLPMLRAKAKLREL